MPDVGKLSLQRVSRLKSLLAKAKAEAENSDPAENDVLLGEDIDWETLIQSAPGVVPNESSASSLSLGTVLILTGDAQTRTHLLFLITDKGFSCQLVDSLPAAQDFMEREPVSVALLDTEEGEDMEVVATQLSGKHELPIVVRSSDGHGFTIAGLDEWSNKSEAEVNLLEAIFFTVETSGAPQEIQDIA